MVKKSILLIEDDPDIVELVQYNLERESYAVFSATDGEQGLAEAKRRSPDLILLDLMLPGIDGLEVCRLAQSGRWHARHLRDHADRPRGRRSTSSPGLELGADDYVTKPFSPRELMARVRAVIRRAEMVGEPERDQRQIGDLVVDRTRYEARLNGEVLTLTRAEFPAPLDTDQPSRAGLYAKRACRGDHGRRESDHRPQRRRSRQRDSQEAWIGR